MQRKYRLLREAAYASGAAEFEALCSEPTFRDFVCLYVAEGYKRNRNRIAICNSDPAVVKVADRWIRRLSQNRRRYAIQCHADQDLDELCAFWSDLLAVEPAAIRTQRKSNSNQLTGRTWRSVHGVLTISCEDTLLRARLEAWMDCIRAEWLYTSRGFGV